MSVGPYGIGPFSSSTSREQQCTPHCSVSRAVGGKDGVASLQALMASRWCAALWIPRSTSQCTVSRVGLDTSRVGYTLRPGLAVFTDHAWDSSHMLCIYRYTDNSSTTVQSVVRKKTHAVGARPTQHTRIYMYTPYLPPIPQPSWTSPFRTQPSTQILSAVITKCRHDSECGLYRQQDTQHLNLAAPTAFSQLSDAIFSILLFSPSQCRCRHTPFFSSLTLAASNGSKQAISSLSPSPW